MTARINAFAEAHPLFGWLGSLFSFVAGTAQWFTTHADDFAKLTGLAATLLGVAAGYYTFRIQRRAWQRAKREDHLAEQD